jgi:hypothetical protein
MGTAKTAASSFRNSKIVATPLPLSPLNSRHFNKDREPIVLRRIFRFAFCALASAHLDTDQSKRESLGRNSHRTSLASSEADTPRHGLPCAWTKMMARSNSETSWKLIVEAVRDYYDFLADDLGAIPSDCIVDAPEGGWPSITQSSLAGLEKTDAVIELLQHLPYIIYSHVVNTQIAFSTIAIDYREFGKHGVAEGTRSQFLPVGDEEFPSHVVVLTEEDEDYYGSLLLIDTQNGRCLTECPMRFSSTACLTLP